ncbi:DUF4321 domain-containing protein [Caloramator sp. mosi_1]|uniref:DUF4321 domain-containing protein n=1 Tax=Caloramator sp. mosi_1 TaxID=3023090 RepID=UPI00236205FF|nr:DUF4321 domain-containing protein [Caloramator sp. mosi_1]WDC83861.1 DUF4321 domain-containing protein [Caloramator sp. mosi_1]
MGKTKEKLFKFMVILLCVLAGEAIYKGFSQIKGLSFLTAELIIGTQKPINLDLIFFNIVIGFNLKLNLFSIIGLILGIILIKRIR